MGLRSRALLTGVATGFLRANNDRRDRMAERLQTLSDNRALMDRERAKSQADAASKAAYAEQKKWSELRSQEFIDDEGNYTKAYHDKEAYLEWTKAGTREAIGNDYESFVTEFAKMGPKKFIRSYKTPEEIQQSLSKVYDSVDARQKADLARPVMTGFDAMFGSMVNRVSSAVGGGNVFGPPSDGSLATTPEVGTVDVMREQEPQGPSEPYESPNFTRPQAAPERAHKWITEADGSVTLAFGDSNGNMVKVPTNLKEATENTTGGNNRKVEKVRLFDTETGQYMSEPTNMDSVTDEILVNGQWILPPSNIETLPADVQLINLVHKDDFGEEVQAQAYLTSGSATGSNIVRMPDGTTWALTGTPVSLRGKLDAHETPKNTMPEAVKQDLKEFGRQRKTASLASTMLRQDFISSPTSWVQANLSVFTDMLGATVGMTGENRPADLQAIQDYVSGKHKGDEQLREAIGTLDAAAVKAGDKEAIQNFLTYALATSQYGGDRLTATAVEEAAKVVKPLMSGTDFNRGALASVVERSSTEMARIAGANITLAMGYGSDSKIWEYYPRVKQNIAKGLTPIPEPVDGKSILKDIKDLERTNKAAYATTVRNLISKFGADWQGALTDPIKFSSKLDTIVMPMYLKNEDGSYTFGVFPVK